MAKAKQSAHYAEKKAGLGSKRSQRQPWRKSRYKFTRALQSPIGRAINSLMYHFPPYKMLVWPIFKSMTSKLAWREIGRDKEFIEGIEQGKRDLAAGRTYHYDPDEGLRGRMRPSEEWKPDDPSQPDGWHHDGTQWVLNEDGGWFQDASGFWRYNNPGEVGWQEQPDGSWAYSKEPTEPPPPPKKKKARPKRAPKPPYRCP